MNLRNMPTDPSIFKAYDIRGVYPEQIDEDTAYRIGQAYAQVFKPEGEVLVGHDVRLQSENLKNNLIKGLVDAGVDVCDFGLISTEMLYFGVGNFGFAGGIQVTASHNPPEWHGMKMVKKGVAPVTPETGGNSIKEFVFSGNLAKGKVSGKIRKYNADDEYCDYLLSNWIDTTRIAPLKIVYNPNFGYEGKLFEKIVLKGKLPLTIIPLNANPDGSFPKGRPDPFVPENRPEFTNLVKEENADLGIAWDADADRVFFCADGGIFLEPYYANTILIEQALKKYPKAKIIYDPRYTWALLDAIKSNGGEPVLVRVGHSYIKEAMRLHNAVFAAESSGHTYYRDFWYADCGLIPALQLIQYLSQSGKKLSEIIKPIMKKYVVSGEINSTVVDVVAVLTKLKNKYSDGKISELDGLSVEYEEFRFNVRASNTEPLLRLNLEARSQKMMEEKRDEVLSLIRS
ncbi:MAG: phosphomannomutase/phosphoglucomutase [Patescibacteria group bacterium]|nr:phosphomannomutase/phosphoglucomutase [Patescibacteria group bacterium]